MTTSATEARLAVKAAYRITSADQLIGRIVVTTTGPTLIQRLRRLEHDNGSSFSLLYGKDPADSFLLLESGRADAFSTDDNTLAGNISNSNSPHDHRFVGKPLGSSRSRS